MKSRLPLALLTGLAGAWLFAGDLLSSSAAGPFLLLIVALAAVGLAWIGLATVEHQSRRWCPHRTASHLLLWRGRLLEPAVGLAVLRGALAGAALLGLEVLLARAGILLADTWLTGTRRARSGFGIIFPLFLDPNAAGQALASAAPAASVLGLVLFVAVVIGIVAVGLPLVQYSKKYPEASVRLQSFYVAKQVGAVILFGAWELHLADFMPCPGAAFLALAAFSALLAWLSVRRDLLTTAFAIATLVLWDINYPMLVFFREVGHAAHWSIFVAWGLVVAMAAGVAFGPELNRAWRQLLSSIE